MAPISILEHSYRFGKEAIDSSKYISYKTDIIDVIKSVDFDKFDPSTKNQVNSSGNIVLNAELSRIFQSHDWTPEAPVYPNLSTREANDFRKDKVSIEVQFGHSLYLAHDMMKLQASSENELTDIAIYITVTKLFISSIRKNYGIKWGGELTFEKVQETLPLYKHAINIPVCVLGIDFSPRKIFGVSRY